MIRSQIPRSQHREHSSPLFMTSSFTFESAEQARAVFADEEEAFIYSRFSNPNYAELVDRMCELEGTEDGIAVASGMSAVFTTFAALLDSGDEIVSSRSLFGSTHKVLTEILPRWGITCNYAEMSEPETWENAITDETRLLYVETPSNPTLDVIDLEWLNELCDRHDLIYVVDNIFATPVLQRPVEYGADLIVHSATKYIDGQGRGIGGLILGGAERMEEVSTFARHTGPSLSPFNAWMFSKSLETLPARMREHSRIARRLAEYLEEHPDVRYVRYPHLSSHPQYEIAREQMSDGGGMVTFVLEGGIERGARFLDELEICSLTANLGDSRTIVTHPASTTHSKLTEEECRAVGILPGLVRISVGLETVDDLIRDLDRAFDRSAS